MTVLGIGWESENPSRIPKFLDESGEFLANRVAPKQLQMEQTLPLPRANCLTHCMLAFYCTISVQ
jgi:hypothetical protein